MVDAQLKIHSPNRQNSNLPDGEVQQYLCWHRRPCTERGPWSQSDRKWRSWNQSKTTSEAQFITVRSAISSWREKCQNINEQKVTVIYRPLGDKLTKSLDRFQQQNWIDAQNVLWNAFSGLSVLKNVKLFWKAMRNHAFRSTRKYLQWLMF